MELSCEEPCQQATSSKKRLELTRHSFQTTIRPADGKAARMESLKDTSINDSISYEKDLACLYKQMTTAHFSTCG